MKSIWLIQNWIIWENFTRMKHISWKNVHISRNFHWNLIWHLELIITSRNILRNKSNRMMVAVHPLILRNLLSFVTFVNYEGEIQRIHNWSSKFCGKININIIFRSRANIDSFFQFKEELSLVKRPCIVYDLECPQCNSKYNSKTNRRLEERI